MMMPRPSPVRSMVSISKGRVSVHGESYLSESGTTRVVASFWQLSKGADTNAMTAFVDSLEHSFRQTAKATIESPLHNRHVANADGGYTTMSVGDRMIGLWVSVQGNDTVYTVSFSCLKGRFFGAESTYLNSFAVISN